MRDTPRPERVTPTLLDRLTDEEPGVAVESRNQWVITPTRYLETVLRDLRWLLGTRTHLPDTPLREKPPRHARRGKPDDDGVDEKVLADFPEVVRSVVAYGFPDVTGVLTADLDIPKLMKVVEEAIRAFEPRVNPLTLQVRAISELPERDGGAVFAAVGFGIQADVLMDPTPEHLYIKTTIDLETGECHLAIAAHGPEIH